MALDFESYAQKGNEFVNLLMKNLGAEDERDRAARILRSVLRTLRNHLSLEESSDLLAQLPMAIKAVYVDGWRMTGERKRINTMQEFANEVLKQHGSTAWRDFSNPEEVMVGVRAVIETLAQYVSVGELEEAFASLPKELREQFMVWIP
ncbi:MAG: DUF2267 domain-containing protein [Cyclobacteriaceae bacterium]|jgi:uncharacterized protein (DUF2267 family)|nr:DUF2267 domain-containing protein [Cyclobacteriaceae bacterium]